MRIIILLLLLFPSALAYEGWLLLGENFTEGEMVFNLAGASQSRDTVILQMNGTTIVARQKETIIKSGYKITYHESRYNATYLSEEEIDIHKPDEPYRFRVAVSKYTPLISAVRTAPVEIEYGSSVPVKLVLKNEGDTDLQVYYVEEVPAYYSYDGLVSFVKDGETSTQKTSTLGKITWRGQIKVGESVNIEYSLKQIGHVKDSLNIPLGKGSYSYSYAEKDYTVELPDSSIRIMSPLVVEVSIEKPSMAVNDITECKLSVRNTYSASVKVKNLRINLPQNVRSTGTVFDLKGTYPSYFWSGTLAAGQNRTFSIPLKAQITGKGSVFVTVDFEYDVYSGIDTKRADLSVELEPISAILDLNTTIVSAYDPFIVNYTLINPNKGKKLSNVKAELTSGFFETSQALFMVLESGFPVKSGHFEVKAPWVYETSQLVLTLKGSYLSENNELFNYSVNRTITVRPIEVSHIFSIEDAVVVGKDDSMEIIVNLTRLMPSEPKRISISIMGSDGVVIESYMLSEAEVLELLENERQTVSFTAKPVNNSTEDYGIEISYDTANITVYEKRFAKYLKKLKEENGTVGGSGINALSEPHDIFAKPESGSNLFETFKGAQLPRAGIGTAIGSSIGLIVLFMIIYFLFHGSKRKVRFENHEIQESRDEPVKEEKPKIEIPKPGKSLEPLEDYIGQCKKAGISMQDIRTSLLENGWVPEVVDVYLK